MAAPAGWFPDPDRPEEWRYWTGAEWAPRSPDAPSPAGRIAPQPAGSHVTVVQDAAKVTDAYAWTLALLPLIGLSVLLATDPTSDTASTVVLLGMFFGQFALAIPDIRALHNAGWSINAGWLLLSPLAYLIARLIRVSGSNPGPMLVSSILEFAWLVAILVTI